FRQEKLKAEARIPAARRYIVEHQLNEHWPGAHGDLGLIVQGGLSHALVSALQRFGLADAFGAVEIPVLVLNVTYPLVPEELVAFCAGKRAVFLLEEGQPEFIEQELATLLRRRDLNTPLHGKDLLPAAGELTVEVMAGGLLSFIQRYLPNHAIDEARSWLDGTRARRDAAAQALQAPLPARPPSFCIGCP